MSTKDYHAIQITRSVCNFQELTSLVAEELRHGTEMLTIEDNFDQNRKSRDRLHRLVDLAANIGLYEKEVRQ